MDSKSNTDYDKEKNLSTALSEVSNQSGESVDDTFIPRELKHEKLFRIKEIELVHLHCSTTLYKSLLLVFAFICGFGYNLDYVLRSIYTSYATNSYSHHSLLSTIQVINAVISVAAQIIFARLSDYCGRLQLFLAASVLYVVGTIIESQAYNVQTYAAGAIFYNTGYVGVFLMMMLIMSDFSSLRWRLLYQFAPTWPFIIITWVSGDIVAAANPVKNWSWDIAMWAFIYPLTALPFVCFVLHMYHSTSKTDEWKALREEKRQQKKRLSQVLLGIFWKLDVVGVFILTVCLGCILVPLTLAGGSSEQWAKSQIIGTLVLGGVLFPIFVLWEARFAKNPVLPASLLKDRGVWGPLCGTFFNDFTYYIAADYLYPVLIVSINESSKSASRITWLPTFIAVALSPFISVLVARTRRLKLPVVLGCALWMVSLGMFYHYRGGAVSHAGIIGASVVMGVGSALYCYLLTVALQAMTSHSRMAVITGAYYTVAKVGSAVGASVSGAVWTQSMYHQLAQHLGNESLAAAAYGSPYTFVAEYVWGTPERDAAVRAYEYVQRILMIIALVFSVPLLLSVLFMRDRPLDDKVARDDVSESGLSSAAATDDDPVLDWFKGMFKCHKENSCTSAV